MFRTPTADQLEDARRDAHEARQPAPREGSFYVGEQVGFAPHAVLAGCRGEVVEVLEPYFGEEQFLVAVGNDTVQASAEDLVHEDDR